jgi:hypothetical protein
MTASADGFLTKPITSMAAFQDKVLTCFPADRHPHGPRIISDEKINPDPIAYQDNMAHVVDVLKDNKDDQTLDYVAQFLSGVARSAKDHGLLKPTKALAVRGDAGQPAASETAQIVSLTQQRLTDRMAI